MFISLNQIHSQQDQNSAFFTLETPSRTATGDTWPITVTLFESTSMAKEVTPAHKIYKKSYDTSKMILVPSTHLQSNHLISICLVLWWSVWTYVHVTFLDGIATMNNIDNSVAWREPYLPSWLISSSPCPHSLGSVLKLSSPQPCKSKMKISSTTRIHVTHFIYNKKRNSSQDFDIQFFFINGAEIIPQRNENPKENARKSHAFIPTKNAHKTN